MQTSAAVPSSAPFVHSPLVEPSPDSMSVSDPDGQVIRLPAYAKGALPITLVKKAPFEIKAQALFTNLDRRSGSLRTPPRFAIRVVQSGQTVFHRQYSADQTSLTQALETALRWISTHLRQQRWSYLCSWPLLSLWTFSIAVGWLFEPIVGWLSFLPLFAGLPFSFYLAPQNLENAPNHCLDRRLQLGTK